MTALSTAQRAELVAIARDAVGNALATGRIDLLGEHAVNDPVLRRPGAAFVTLLRGDRLLGCVGSLRAVEPLALAVHRAALQAAFADPRLPAVTADDFSVMTIKVSVLSEPVAMDVESYGALREAVRVGVDGLVVDAPGHRATLLPSVWEQCPDADTFLGALWAKAGLRPGAWPRGLRVDRYTTEEFSA